LSALAFIATVAMLYTILVSTPLSTLWGMDEERRETSAESLDQSGTFVTSLRRPAGQTETAANKCQFSNLGDSIEVPSNFSAVVANYRAQIPDLMKQATQRQQKGMPEGHQRFAPFSPLFQCKDVSSIGGRPEEDTSKLVCGVKNLQEGCIVYSIGGNNQWEFELDIVKQTPCSVYTFDCTGPRNRFEVPKHDRIHFEHICLGTHSQDADSDCSASNSKCGPTMTLQKIQEKLNHNKAADLLKMDIEGYEIPLFQSWKEASNYPQQILVEVHYMTQFEDIVDDYHKRNGLSIRTDWEVAFEEDFIHLSVHLMDLGYFTAIRNDNSICKHCTELSLVQLNTHCAAGLE
jgi:Methyltransferase domain